MGITLKEIAEMTGYGYGTVSRALSDNPKGIKKETRDKILKIAEKYGYVKNTFAQALVSGMSKDIGLIVPAIFDSIYYRDFYIKAMSGIRDALSGSEYKLRIIFLREAKIKGILEEIAEMKLGGVILSPYCQDFLISEDDIRAMNIPAVVLGKEVQGDNITSILLDDFRGGYDGALFLHRLGHEKIAVIRGFRDDIESRYKGFKRAMADNNMKVPENFILQGDALEGSGYELTIKLLGKKSARPTAIFCLDDEMAYGAIRAIKEKGLKCPGDISILGFDGISMDEYMDPPLTTMERPVYEMAQEAAKVIIEYEKERHKKVIKFEAMIVERSTCRRVA